MLFNNINFINNITFMSENSYINKFWLIYSHLISLFIIIIFIIFLGIIFLNNAKHIKILNLFCGYYILIYFLFNSLNYPYDLNDINQSFNQNITVFVNLFIFISTLTVILFFLAISDVFYSQENSKIEFSLLILFIYTSAIYLISSTDFISIIILLECIAFSSYILVGFERLNKFSTTAALKYLIIASIPGGLFILGIALLYYNYGSFSQDYLLLVLQELTINNFYDNYFINNELANFWFYINEYCIAERARDAVGIHEQFALYLKSLDSYLSIGIPAIVFKLGIVENILIEQKGLLKANILTEFDIATLSKYYQKVIENYCEILSEIHQFYFMWKFYGESQHVEFSQNGILKILFESSFDSIWMFFSLMNMAEFQRLSNLFNNNTYIINILWGVYQIEDFQQFSLLHFYQYLGKNILNGNSSKSFEELFVYYNSLKASKQNFLNVYHEVLLQELPRQSKQEYYIEIYHFITQIFGNPFWKDQHPSQLVQGTYDGWRDMLCYQKTWTDNVFMTYVTYFENTTYYSNIFLTIYLVIILMLINLSFKLTAAPFHLWAPSIYGNSPLAVLTFLSIFSKLTIVFFIIWLFVNIFDNLKFIWQPLFLGIAFLSIFVSILGAFSEKIFKRFFVYSSIGHVGFMLIGISVLTINSIKSTLDYLIIYIISSYLIWFIIMYLSTKTRTIINIKGLYLNQPFLAMMFSLVLFSMSGIPPMGGFFVKYEIFYSLINSSFFYFAYILLILTIISFFYYLRLIKILFFEDNKTIVKYKFVNDIKLRIISYCFFIIPFFMIFIENPLAYLLNSLILNSLF